uniref:B-type cyclin 2 n=1 Tax=Ganoderma boninense TaxID=34458 RepID=A0A5K1K2Y3_9APHY|nr:B-type cyclin 2 [Ganoderma boninense]
MHALPSFDSLPPDSFSPVPSTSMLSVQSNPAHPSHIPDRPHISLPRVGETRCYWTLLTSDLTFLYLDPVLASHLGEQADLLIGKPLLAYVHPDEQASAKVDLGAVLESRTLHGSVTRLLGYNGPSPQWIDAEKVTEDSNYMAVDIVINYAADELVLCFIHAVVDLTPRDNDEHNKTCWTNWCGTACMGMDQVQLLYGRLQHALPSPPTMSRVFQILLNQPNRPLCLSWPQERPGEPASKDLARLAEDIHITNNGTDAKTSCTRRFKACQITEFTMGDKREVESIFIPHGAIIFACHKITPYPRSGVVGGNGIPQLGYHSSNYAPQGNAQFYDSNAQNLPQNPHNPHVSPLPPYTYSPQPQPPMSSSSYPPNAWMNMESSGSPNQYAHWAPSSLPSVAPVSSLRSSSYSAPPPPSAPQHQWSQQAPYMETDSPVSPDGPSAPSPGGMYPASAPPEQDDQPPPSPPGDLVPAPRSGRRSNRDQYGNGGRTAGNPPVGITRCASCKVTHSPEWRKGPSGKKDLCNACGLRFARSRAKKEGGNQRRRTKDRAMSTLSTKPDPSPSASPVSASYPTMRRGSYFEEGSFISTSSAGSGSGNDSFSHGPTFDGMTPSPSPPSGGMHYVPGHAMSYPSAMQADRPGFGGQPNPGQFYLPPPQSGYPQSGAHHVPSNGHHPHPHPLAPARLDPVVPFPSRLSPLVSPSSPISNSPLSAGLSSSGLSSASYERDKRRDRETEQHLLMAAQSPLGPEHTYRMGKQYMAREAAPF